jgi:hypothetical protein
MSPDTDTELQRRDDADGGLEATGDELEERIEKLDEHIDEAKKGLRARAEDADDDELEEEDGDEDPLAFDDPEADEEDDEE